MNKVWLILIVVIILISTVFASKALLFNGDKNHKVSVPDNTPAVNITYENLPSVLGQNNIVNAIPSDEKILLRFYNFDSGVKTIEKSYILEKGEITPGDGGTEKIDIILSLDSKYLVGWTNKNFCSIIQKANNAGDLGFETSLSQASLAWKFKSMYQYRECFGF